MNVTLTNCGLLLFTEKYETFVFYLGGLHVEVFIAGESPHEEASLKIGGHFTQF
jgi:hypothetical protein